MCTQTHAETHASISDARSVFLRFLSLHVIIQGILFWWNPGTTIILFKKTSILCLFPAFISVVKNFQKVHETNISMLNEKIYEVMFCHQQVTQSSCDIINRYRVFLKKVLHIHEEKMQEKLKMTLQKDKNLTPVQP